MNVFNCISTAVIQSKHLLLYTARVEMGLSRHSPEVLSHAAYCDVYNVQSLL